jgi:hypothetical protein
VCEWYSPCLPLPRSGPDRLAVCTGGILVAVPDAIPDQDEPADVPEAIPTPHGAHRYQRAKFGRAARRQFLDLIASGTSRTSASRACDVTWRTVRYHLENDRFFRYEFEAAEEALYDEVEGSLVQTALSGDKVAAIYVLQNRRPERWRDARRIEHTGRDGGPIEHTAEVLLPAELKAKALAILHAARAEHAEMTLEPEPI